MKKFQYNSTYKVYILFSKSLIFENFFNYTYFLLLGQDAYFLLNFLINESENKLISNLFMPSSRITNNINFNQNQVVEAFSIMEDLNLINIYFNKEKNQYIYELKSPLKQNDFFNNSDLCNLLLEKIGKENYDLNISILKNIVEEEITKDFELLNNNDYQSIDSQIEILNFENKNYKLPIETKKYSFSLLLFLKQKKIDTKKFWNQEFEKLLSNYSNIYNLDDFDFLRLILESLDKNKNFNLENFKTIIETNYQSKILNIKNLDEKNIKLKHLEIISPEKFLINIFNISKVLSSHKELINILRKNYKFSDYIINILLDYSYLVNNQKIIKNYILKIADSIVEENIRDSKNLISYLKKSFKYRNNSSGGVNFLEEKGLENMSDVTSIAPKQLFKDLLLKHEK